jgi:hypothetical protein
MLTVTAVYGCRAVDGPDLEHGSTRYGPYRVAPVPCDIRAVPDGCGALTRPSDEVLCTPLGASDSAYVSKLVTEGLDRD